jgi:hypothetical protein
VIPDSVVSARQRAAVATGTRRKRLVLFGGWARDPGALADLWEWNGRRWERIGPGPQAP